MPEALILEFSEVTEADYASVNGHLGIDMQHGRGGLAAGGLLSHRRRCRRRAARYSSSPSVELPRGPRSVPGPTLLGAALAVAG